MQIMGGLTDRFEACFEVSCGYVHFHDLLQPIASRVVVAHPSQLRLIFRSKDKNDRNDAERLAKLLYLGEVPTVHVPSLDVRTWRELINCGQTPINVIKTAIGEQARREATRFGLRSCGADSGLWNRLVLEEHLQMSQQTPFSRPRMPWHSLR
jgi:hypothetical protein